MKIISACADKVTVDYDGNPLVFKAVRDSTYPPGTFVAKEGDGLPSMFEGFEWFLSMIDVLGKNPQLGQNKEYAPTLQNPEITLQNPQIMRNAGRNRESGVMNSWVESVLKDPKHVQWHRWKYLGPKIPEGESKCECESGISKVTGKKTKKETHRGGDKPGDSKEKGKKPDTGKFACKCTCEKYKELMEDLEKAEKSKPEDFPALQPKIKCIQSCMKEFSACPRK